MLTVSDSESDNGIPMRWYANMSSSSNETQHTSDDGIALGVADELHGERHQDDVILVNAMNNEQ